MDAQYICKHIVSVTSSSGCLSYSADYTVALNYIYTIQDAFDGPRFTPECSLNEFLPFIELKLIEPIYPTGTIGYFLVNEQENSLKIVAYNAAGSV